VQRCASLVVSRTAQSGGVSAAEQGKFLPASPQPVHSHVLAAVGYRQTTSRLEVEFISGAIYRYSNVPPQLYRDFLSAASKTQSTMRMCAAFSVGPCQTAANLMFVLTREEKRVICFVMLAILVGLGVKELPARSSDK